MQQDLYLYILLYSAILVSIIADLGLFKPKNKIFTLKGASLQYLFWVLLAIGFGVLLFYEKGKATSLKYFTCYLMEMSLSIDNVFVFVLLFKSFKIRTEKTSTLLLWGIMLAIFFRGLFIFTGIELVTRFSWILYLFGAFLIYSGIKIFFKKEHSEAEDDPHNSKLFKFLNKNFRIASEQSDRLWLIKNGKLFLTTTTLIIIMLALTDIMFAVDSIPAVLAFTTEKIVVYASNFFAILGLRPLYTIVQKAADKFDYMQEGIAVVLIAVGFKLFSELIHVHLPEWLLMTIIFVAIFGAIILSIFKDKKKS